MGNWVSNIIGGSIGEVVSKIGNTIKQFIPNDVDRMKAQGEIEKILQTRDADIETTIRQELSSKEKILIAELQQGDNYTKRARPTLVYTGLAVIIYNYCAVPTIQMLNGLPVVPFQLPTEFWVAWGGVVGTWVVGRSMEKRGIKNKAVSLITG